MKKIKNIIPGLLVISVMLAQTANAAVDTAVLLSITGIAEMALLLCIVVCLLWSMKIMSLVKGGLMSKSWQMFTLGFTFLLTARLVIMSSAVGFFVFPEYASTALYLLMAITWMVGIFQTKRILA